MSERSYTVHFVRLYTVKSVSWPVKVVAENAKQAEEKARELAEMSPVEDNLQWDHLEASENAISAGRKNYPRAVVRRDS